MRVTEPKFWLLYCSGLTCLTTAFVVGIRLEAKHRRTWPAGLAAFLGILGVYAAPLLWTDPGMPTGIETLLAVGLLFLFPVVVAISILFTHVGYYEPTPVEEDDADDDS